MSTTIKFSPYTFARVAVMKSELLGRDSYDRMQKMGYNEILRLLQDTTYKAEIDSFDVSTEGINTIEHALNANLCASLRKLHRISQGGMRLVVAAFGLRYDMENVKVIVRAISSGIAKEDVQKLMYESLNYPATLWETLLAQTSIEGVLKHLPFTIQGTSLFELENSLDRYYSSRMNAFIGTLSAKNKVIAGFVEHELEVRNINTILRLHGIKEYNIVDYLITPSSFVKRLVGMSSISDIVTALRNAKKTTLQGDEKDLLVALEIDMEQILLTKQIRLMHAGLLTANYILGYLFAKEIEVRNLKALIKGKKLGLPEEFVQSVVVSR
ncbi:TPA: hypothetical protein HA278_05100 [Candidatus Woesearchaeota archaeon]|nr:hypothetical protein [archaeon]HIJ11408.1 hypothetical protein [Candidatus Woesearchaeota archaeon]